MQLLMDGNRGIADILEACHGQTTQGAYQRV